MVNTQQAVVMTAAGLAVIALVAAVIVLTSVSLLTSGTIVSSNPDLKIFADQACTKQISTVQWGTLQPSGSATVALFIKNSGNMPLTLTLTENNWSPAQHKTILRYHGIKRTQRFNLALRRQSLSISMLIST